MSTDRPATNDLSFESLIDIIWSFQAAYVLHVANTFDIFTQLSQQQPISSKELAVLCRTDATMTEKLLISCAALGLLEREDNFFKNAPIAEQYLVRDSPLYQGHLIMLASNVSKYFCHLDEVTRSGTREPIWRIGELWNDFILGMHERGTGVVAESLIKSVDLSKRKKLLDVGGGSGIYAVALCQRYTTLHAVIFDIPKTLCIAQNTVDQSGMTDRIIVQSGDWYKDEFGGGYDVILLSQVLYESREMEIMKLSKSYNAMVSGGLLVIQEYLLDDDKNGPQFPAFFNLMLEAHSVKEMLDYIAESGFVDGKLIENGPQGLRIITAQKP